MTSRRKKRITYEQLEGKYNPPSSFSSGLKRGAEGVAMLSKTKQGRKFVGLIFLIVGWPIFSLWTCSVLQEKVSRPLGGIVGLIMLVGCGIAGIVWMSIQSVKERKSRMIERFGTENPPFGVRWAAAKEDLMAKGRKIMKQTQKDVYEADITEYDRIQAMIEEMKERYSRGEVSESDLREFEEKVRNRLKVMDSKLHKYGFRR
jgi:hypothetical protein